MITVTSDEVCSEIPLSRNPVDSRGIGKLVGSFSSEPWQGSCSSRDRFTREPSRTSTARTCVASVSSDM